MEAAQVTIILARAVYYVSIVLLFGAAVFPLYAGRSTWAALPRWLTAALAVATVLALLTWLFALAATLDDTGEVLPTVKVILTESSFRMVWLVRLGAALLLLLIALALRPSPVIATPSAVLLIGEGWGGHAVAWGTLGSVNLAVHTLCAALWLGGLVPLGLVVFSAHRGSADLPTAETALRRFSSTAVMAVAGVVATGAVNTWHMLGAGPNFTDAYVRVLALKITLVMLMIGLAALNRYRFLPQLRTAGRAATMRSLVGSITLEQLVGLLVLLDVSVLGTMNPHA
ncbi:CopD family protein [Methylobacterium durans]|uniref:Copper resistance protein n=1 Tax=Methylobacterium durans TaxID=2202825 RepID=A0A2U8WBN2_9HYPH|nr:CopD family protein [Methylobacterium durans]AWN42726.1 copper resistance protein [Methylobacterium durans]